MSSKVGRVDELIDQLPWGIDYSSVVSMLES